MFLSYEIANVDAMKTKEDKVSRKCCKEFFKTVNKGDGPKVWPATQANYNRVPLICSHTIETKQL